MAALSHELRVGEVPGDDSAGLLHGDRQGHTPLRVEPAGRAVVIGLQPQRAQRALGRARFRIETQRDEIISKLRIRERIIGDAIVGVFVDVAQSHRQLRPALPPEPAIVALPRHGCAAAVSLQSIDRLVLIPGLPLGSERQVTGEMAP